MSLINYINGLRHGKDAHQLEREAMQDPFLSDAIDGYDLVKESQIERLGDMRRRISHKAVRTNRQFTYAGIAASLVAFVAFGCYLLFNEKSESFLAENIVEDKPVSMSAMIEENEDFVSAINDHSAGDSSDIAVVAIDIPKDDEKEKPQELIIPASLDKVLSQSDISQTNKKVAKLETPEPEVGWKNYKKYLKDSLHHPSDVDCAKLKGIVVVTFNVDEDGKPYDFIISKSLCPDADAEAIRLIKDGCLWTCKSVKRMAVDIKF